VTQCTKKKPRGLTLADVDISFDSHGPRCGHCGRAFLSSSPVQIDKQYIVVHCIRPDCRCMSPFRRTA